MSDVEGTAVAATAPAPAAPAAPVAPTVPAAAPAAPAAPQAPAAAPPPPESTKPAPPPPQDHRSLKARARSSALERARAVEQRDRAAVQPREPAGERGPEGQPKGGQFTKEGGAEPPAAGQEPPAPTPATAAAEPAPGAAPQTEAAPATPAHAAKTVKIPIADGHPFRARGITEWEVPVEQEREQRAMLNSVAERAQLREELRQQRAQQAVLEARLKVQQGELPYRPSAEADFLLKEIGEKYSPEMAALVRQGLESLNTQALRDAEAGALRMEQERAVSEQFVGEVAQEASRRFPVWAETGQLDGQMTHLLGQYGVHVDRRNADRQRSGLAPIKPSAAEFFPWAAQAYLATPAVQQSMKLAVERERRSHEEQIRAEERERIKAEEQRRLEAAATRHGARPPSLPAVGSAGAAVDPDAGDTRKLAQSPSRKKLIRQAIGERFGRLGG